MKRRYALVTAGAQGLGLAITRHLAAQHYTVLVHYYSSQAAAESLQADIAAAGGEAICLQADLACAAARERLMQEVAATTSALHVLVNNLGWYLMERLPHITLEQWEQAIALNCTATFHLTQLALPLLEAATPPGRVINLGDSACDRIEAHVMATPYHIAKLGVHVLTRSYAQLLMPKGITINMISPGFLENSVGSPPQRLPAGHPGRFSDILGALDYLLSEAASAVSGTNLLASGAWNLG
ncbi:MAG: SDR family NAD(P)-dependent oxidoreductase [Candidatus Tectomicrobia bacterium]|uniref:SDR family NAD(P)-dependent oxidoreductase n=1 Tax=Tectimicrobiota bacterium TaxID=2528274 RepID=A0A937VYF7_UNCTE|nr:SDR family NAD(P)-dependent oxidoreductase [Candidatus Tectomicrobia bacterium]